MPRRPFRQFTVRPGRKLSRRRKLSQHPGEIAATCPLAYAPAPHPARLFHSFATFRTAAVIATPTQHLWYRNAPARCISLRCSTRRASLPRWPRLPIRLSPTTLPCAPTKPAGRIGATRQRNGPATRQILIFGALGGGARPARIAGCHARQLRDCASVKLGHYYGIHFRLSSALPVCG
jgi:hypothetical protein